MSVFIRGMSMPTGCVDCPLNHDATCSLIPFGLPDETNGSKRRDDCPLEEITEVDFGTFTEGIIKSFNIPEAKTEVKRPRWVKAKGRWCTPGGDPVWECSECGKGRHVYGIEHGTYGADVADGQWVSCPNCGARMEEQT